MQFSKTILLSVVALAALTACGPKGSAPSVPNDAARGSSDANPASTPPTPAPGDNTHPYDATVAHRLLALPPQVQAVVKECEAQGKFYVLGDQLCAAQAPAPVSCALNDAFRALLDPSTLKPLDEYLATKVPTHRLYGCTEEGPSFTLHFYRYENSVVNYKKLNIAKATP